MKHLPNDEWLFDPKSLGDEERDLLEEHIAACDDCRALASAWSEVERHLVGAETVSPAPGFALRWQETLVERKLARRRRQAWVFLGALMSVGLAFTGLLGVDVWSKLTSPADLVFGWSQSVRFVLELPGEVQDFLFGITQITQEVPVLMWVALAATVLWLSGLWGALVYRFATKFAENGV